MGLQPRIAKHSRISGRRPRVGGNPTSPAPCAVNARRIFFTPGWSAQRSLAKGCSQTQASAKTAGDDRLKEQRDRRESNPANFPSARRVEKAPKSPGRSQSPPALPRTRSSRRSIPHSPGDRSFRRLHRQNRQNRTKSRLRTRLASLPKPGTSNNQHMKIILLLSTLLLLAGCAGTPSAQPARHVYMNQEAPDKFSILKLAE